MEEPNDTLQHFVNQGNCYLRKNTADNISTFGVMVHYNLVHFRPIGLYFFKIVQSISPSAPPDIPYQFLPVATSLGHVCKPTNLIS